MRVLGDNNEKEPKTGFLSNLINKIKSGFIGGNGGNSLSVGKLMTRNDLENLVVNVFKDRMDRLTTNRSLLFHAKFEIYMHKNDYDNLQGAYGPTSTDLAEIFHEIIRDKCIELKEKNKNFEYTPHTRRWYFQFLPYHENEIAENTQEAVPQGTILARTEVYTPAIGNDETKDKNINIVATQKVTGVAIVTHQDKNVSHLVNNVSIDENNYKDLIILDSNTFLVPFKEVKKAVTPPKSLAQFMWSGSKADMNQSDIKIAGNINKVLDGGIPVVNLKNDNILSPHAHIRYDESSGEFKIMAFGDTKLNGRNLPLKEWCNLPKKNAKILMGSGFNVVQMEFDGLV